MRRTATVHLSFSLQATKHIYYIPLSHSPAPPYKVPCLQSRLEQYITHQEGGTVGRRQPRHDLLEKCARTDSPPRRCESIYGQVEVTLRYKYGWNSNTRIMLYILYDSKIIIFHTRNLRHFRRKPFPLFQVHPETWKHRL